MSEKVLKGYYEEDAEEKKTSKKVLGKEWGETGCLELVNSYNIEKDKLVSVRLASESVDLKALKEFCKENYLPYNQDICNLIEWAEKEAKKKN